MKRLAAFSLVVVLCACEQADPLPPTNVVPARLDQVAVRTDFALAPDETSEARLQGAKAAFLSVLEIGREAEDWREAHALAQEAIQRAEAGIHRSNVEQATAKLLLTGYLVPNQSAEGVSQLASNYADVLVRRESPEAETVLQTLEAFGDTWSPDRVRSLAIGAAEAAEAYETITSSCQDCAMPEEAQRDQARRGRDADVAMSRRLQAAAQLRKMAE